MKKFLLKLFYLSLIFLSIISFLIFVDIFNVFHWQKIRVTKAEPNRNFVKTKYILKNPDKYNSFLFGHSKVENLIPQFMPTKDEYGNELRWYNLEYSAGSVAENYETLRTFVNNGIKIKYVIFTLDPLTMTLDINKHKKSLLRQPYSTYENNPLKFYWMYIWNSAKIKDISELFPEIYDNYKNPIKYKYYRYLFYEFGVEPHNVKLSLEDDNKMKRFRYPSYFNYEITSIPDDIEKIANLCKTNNIQFFLIIHPTYYTTYLYAYDNGNFKKFMRDVSYKHSYYNFAGMNKFNTVDKYFFDSVHYKPYVGKRVITMIFGSDNEKDEIIRELDGNKTFGMKVDKNNIDNFLQILDKEIESYNRSNKK